MKQMKLGNIPQRVLAALAFFSTNVRVAALERGQNGVTSTHFRLSSMRDPPFPVLESPKVLPVPTVVRCIVIMSCQFMVLFTALALCRTVQELTGTAKGRLEAALRAAAQTLTYGPMLCALFIACHLRVAYLSHGEGEPQAWVQSCMYGLTFVVLANAMLVLITQLVIGKPLPPKAGPFDLERNWSAQLDSKRAFYALTILRYLLLLLLYGGLAGVIVGILAYLPPGAKKRGDVEAPASAVTCTMVLSIAFFSSQLIIAACRSYSELTRVDSPQVVGMMHAAATTADFAPMLAVLFLACRMRALQHDAQPQDWAQSCMFAATGAMCITSLLAVMVPLTLGGTLKTNPWTSEVIVEVPKPALGYIFMTMRCLSMLCLAGGAAGVMISMFVFESPGPLRTSPVSPTLQCVVNLACQFFFVYFVVTVMLTVSELTGGTIPMERWSLFPAVESARSTLAFAPVLSTLLVATQMYTLSVTGRNGVPPSWVQGAMYTSTLSLQVSGLMCLATGFVMAQVEFDFDGNVVNRFSNWYMGIVLVVLRYTSMLLLYGGVVIVMIGLFNMTPAIASGREPLPYAYSPVAFRPSR